MKATILTLAAVLVTALILPARAATGLYEAAVLADNPVLYYGLDETTGTTANDSATADGIQNGTYTGTYTLGQPGALTGANLSTAVAFAPTGYINSTFVLTPTSSFTVEFWLNLASLNTGDDQTILSQTTAAGRDVVYWDNAAQKLDSFLGSTDHFWVPNTPLVVGQYTFVDLVYDSGTNTYTWYEDGASAGSGSMTPTAASGTVTIGIHKDLASAPLDGTLDEFAIYAAALTGTQVENHFEAASAPEPSSLALLGVSAAMILRRKRSLA